MEEKTAEGAEVTDTDIVLLDHEKENEKKAITERKIKKAQHISASPSVKKQANAKMVATPSGKKQASAKMTPAKRKHDNTEKEVRAPPDVNPGPTKEELAEKLEECLQDKASAPYENQLEFAELVGFTRYLSARHQLTPLSFHKLGEALASEAKNWDTQREWQDKRRSHQPLSLPQPGPPQPVRTPLLQRLFRELFTALGYRPYSNEEQMDDGGYNSLLWRVLMQWRHRKGAPVSTQKGGYIYKFHPFLPDTLLALIDERGRSKLELCCWPTEVKLHLARSLIDALLVVQWKDGREDDEPCIQPIVRDREGRKFWYFGDTHLFMEELEAAGGAEATDTDTDMVLLDEENRKEEEKTITEREIKRAQRCLLTSTRFRVVCKTVEEWEQLARVYEQRKEFHSTRGIEVGLQRVKEVVRKLAEEEERAREEERKAQRAIDENLNRMLHKFTVLKQGTTEYHGSLTDRQRSLALKKLKDAETQQAAARAPRVSTHVETPQWTSFMQQLNKGRVDSNAAAVTPQDFNSTESYEEEEDEASDDSEAPPRKLTTRQKAMWEKKRRESHGRKGAWR